MSSLACPIQGTAAIREHRNDDGAVRLEWIEADPEIHVTKELLEQADPDGLAFLKDRYELGADCPYDQRSVHATRRDES